MRRKEEEQGEELGTKAEVLAEMRRLVKETEAKKGTEEYKEIANGNRAAIASLGILLKTLPNEQDEAIRELEKEVEKLKEKAGELRKENVGLKRRVDVLETQKGRLGGEIEGMKPKLCNNCIGSKEGRIEGGEVEEEVLASGY